MASKVNYQKGYNLSALDVYNLLDSSFIGTPEGTIFWISRAYPLYNVGVSVISDSVGASLCYNLLSSGKPLHIHLEGTKIDHAVLIAGVYFLDTSGTGGIYTLMDPNVPSLVSIAVQPSVIQNGSGFNYVTYGSTYTNWYETIY